MESSSKVLSNIVEDLPENAKSEKQSVDEEVTVTIKKPAAGDNVKVEKAVKVKNEHEQIEPSSAEQAEIVEVIEEEDENEGDDGDEVEEGAKRKIVEEITEIPDGGQTKTITVTTVKKVEPDNSSNTVATASSVAKENSPSKTASEETKTKTTEDVVQPAAKELQQPKQEEAEEEEEEEEEEETEGEEEVEANEHLKKEEEPKKSDDSSSAQERKQDQIPQEPETEPLTAVKEETVVDASSAVPPTKQHENNIASKQENFNSTIKDIISSIDSNIKAEENIAALKERELELLKKQQELEREIEQQKLLAQKLANKNQLNQQHNHKLFNQENIIPSHTYQPVSNVSKYTTFEEKHDNNVYSRKSETFESRESTNVSKKVDLNKIFTPATDTEEILPKNRKLYASSAFYSPTLHPTVEDQVELARRISHSLSDISNHQSRGQSMYVNRKKRSVKWVHEGCGQDGTKSIKVTSEEEYDQEEKENDVNHHEKVPLKFLMNPSGQMRDINSLRESINTETGLLSPDVSAEVVTALQAQKGKGAELFAKRRKVSDKWVVDESNVGVQSPSGLPDYHQYQQQPKPCTSPSILPAYTDVAKHRVQLNLHQEQLLEKYARPGLKVVQTPWEAALNSGSASAAFVEEQKLSPYLEPTLTPSPTPQIFDASQGGISFQSGSNVSDGYNKTYSTDDYQKYQTYAAPQQQAQHKLQQYSGSNSKRELAYKPSIPQGWKAPSMSLPKGFEEKKEIQVYFTASEVKHVQQQEQKQKQQQLQHILTVNEAAKSCEEFHTTDETELIELIPHEDAQKGTNFSINDSQATKHLLHTEAHEFVNHLVKSPELRVSPIPITTQIIYDNTVQELHTKQLKDIKRSADSCDSRIEKFVEEKVNVRKQLQQYEDLHRHFSKQIEQEKFLEKKREAAKQKAWQKNSKTTTTKASEQTHLKSNQQQETAEKQDTDDYVKVPVKDLITNFEQQSLQEEKLSSQPALSADAKVETEQQVETDTITEKFNEDLYMPKEIPLQSYAPPPVAAIPSPYSSNAAYESNQYNTYKPLSSSPMTSYSLPESAPYMTKSYGGSSTFPTSKPYQQGFSSTYGNSQPPKQQYFPPQSYQKVPQNTSPNIPQVSFNPSPLPYDKLAKFENQPTDDGPYNSSPTSRAAQLNVRGSRVRNISPAPFAGSYNRAYVRPSDSHCYGGTPSVSPRPLSSTQQYSGHNTPNVTNNQILNAPSYNTSARGWGCSGAASTGYQYQSHIPATKPQIINTTSMPYTDF